MACAILDFENGVFQHFKTLIMIILISKQNDDLIA